MSRKRTVVLAVAAVLLAGGYCGATTITVGLGGGYDYSTIQVGIDAATTGDTVLVHPGTYVENIYFRGKNIILRSTDPADTATVAATIIDGNSSGSVVTFTGTELASCILSGFTIQNGSDRLSYLMNVIGGGISGGTEEQHTLATIENNVIQKNDVSFGGGLAWCDGTIRDNRIFRNHGGNWGGGLFECDGLICDNTISSCTSFMDGGAGLYGCDGVILGNRITGNTTYHFEGAGLCLCNGLIVGNLIQGNQSGWPGINDGWAGGGLGRCNGEIRNNLVVGNRAPFAGGLYWCDGIVENNTIVGNISTGGGVGRCNGPIRNCVIWGNFPFIPWPGDNPVSQVTDSSTPTYSCIQFWTGGGEGNLAEDPLFADPDGPDDDPATFDDNNYYFSPDSPCIDAGDPDAAFNDAGRPPGLGGPRNDMGTYGGPQNCLWPPQPQEGTIRVGKGLGFDYSTIQAGIDAATTGDTILVYPGTYVENIHFNGKNIVLRSTDPTDTPTVAATIIDGNSSGSVVKFSGTETGSCVLSGVTIRNGWAQPYGGGICGGTTETHTRATIRRNRILDNYVGGMGVYSAVSEEGYGGGLAFCDGTITDNLIAGNDATRYGGGLYACYGRVVANMITANFAYHGGGGLDQCGGEILNNLVYENRGHIGGGLRQCNGLIANCTITTNHATLICARSVCGSGRGGGLADCAGTITDCIIWNNVTALFPQYPIPLLQHQISGGTTPTFSCIGGWEGDNRGNLGDDPLFTTGPLGAFYLSQAGAGQAAQSPCVDAGSGLAAAFGIGDRTTRTDGGADSGIVDMGYHYPLPSGPDLAIRFGGIKPLPVTTGFEIWIEGEVFNRGDRATSGAFWVEFRAIPVPDGEPVFLCDSILVGPLEAGESFDLSAAFPRVVYEAVPQGFHTIEVRVDATDQVPESNETNNVVRIPRMQIFAGLPNLTALYLDFSPNVISPAGGDEIRFAGGIYNTGAIPATGDAEVSFHVSPVGAPETTGTLLCDPLWFQSDLVPYGPYLLEFHVFTTYALPPGRYHIAVVIEPMLGNLPEQNYDDNVVWIRYRTLYVGVEPSAARNWQLLQ